MADAPLPPAGPWTERHPLASFQLATWGLLTGTLLLPAFVSRTVGLAQGLPWVAAWTLSGVACSSAMAWAYARAPESMLRATRVVFVVLPLSMAGSLAWMTGLWLLSPLVGTEPWLPPELPPDRQLPLGLARGSLLLALWSSLYLVTLLSRRVMQTRQRSLQAEALADQAQLQLLRSQVNPHFLFNALNSVVGLISEHPRGAQTMVRDLALLLRRSLEADGRQDTTVGDELGLVRLYLKCEQVRFEDRLQVTFDVQGDVEARPLPPMLLQPLVENALQHGLKADAPLRVHIAARVEGERLLLEVRNSGTLNAPRDPLLPPSTGLGLQNVRRRLALLFPAHHAFDLLEQGGEVVARLTLPGGA